MQPFGATNAPDTCLWCGRKLRKNKWKFERLGKLGAYADGVFCGLGCGYHFGVALAWSGRRLTPKGVKP